MKMIFSFLKFEEKIVGGKEYTCEKRHSGHLLGKVFYEKPWGAWVFEVFGCQILDCDLLKDVLEFMEQLKE